MSNVKYHVLDNSIVITYQGKPEVISASDKRYDRILGLIRDSKTDPAALDKIPDLLADTTKGFESSGLELRDGALWDGDTALPNSLTHRIIKLRDMGLPYDPLIKFWENLKKNPSFNSRAMLYKFLEHNGHPLTEDGCFIAYRGVREDFKDKHTGKFDNSPGQVLEMPREQVDDNPKNTCSTGLHVACYEYAKGFGERLVEVKVNPTDVVAVPEDYNGTKMRVCKFEVIQECQDMRKEEVYENPESIYEDDEDDSDYFAQDDEDDLDYPENTVEDDEEEEKSEDHFCGNCGNKRDPFANFCSKCGHEF